MLNLKLLITLLVLVIGGYADFTLADDPAASQPDEQKAIATGDSITLRPQEITVSASRIPEPLFQSPVMGHVVADTEMIRKLYRSTPEALAEIPGVLIQKTSQGQTSPYIRGFTGFRTLMLVDGIRLNNSVFRDGPNEYWGTVDNYSLERLEVIKGPSSVLYGSDAIGGTVAAITNSPYTWDTGIQTGGSIFTRMASADQSYTIHPEFSVTSDEKIGLLLTGTFKEYNDLRGGRDTGMQENSAYGEWDGIAKMEYRIDNNRKVVVCHQRYEQNNAPRTHATIYAQSFDGTAIGSDLRRDFDRLRELTYIQFHGRDLEPWLRSMRASLSWQTLSETEDRIRSSGSRSLDGFDVGTLGSWLQLESPTPIGTLVYGFEHYYDNVNSFSSRNAIQGPVADDAKYHLLGIYVQDTIPITPRMDLVLGGRWTYARAEADSYLDPVSGNRASLEQDWQSVVGSARLSYQLVPQHWSVYGGISQGFRAPNLSDLTRFDTARSNELETPAPGLEPEYYMAYEVGIKATYDNFAFQAACFYTVIDDMIIRVPTGRIIDSLSEVTKLNGGDGYVQGIELGASYRFHPDWTVFGSFTLQDGMLDGYATSAPVKARDNVSRLMPITTLVGLRWQPNRKYWIESLITIADAQDNLSFSDARDTQRIPPGGTPSYNSVTIRGGWQLCENALLTMAVENIFNEDYRIHGSGINAPGINFIFGLKTQF